ncbi:MAG: hypothetical protein FWE30_06680 [Bacteroidales bacterium]|nr:hypothetical protein [Bacteroidales bacterium]MCL2739115.1 hypothetical protein [Bacteroidales bacterium]
MKKLSFSILLVAALCFAACGSNQSKKAEAAAVETECTDSCCGEVKTKTDGCGDAEKSCCGGEECAGKKATTSCGGDGGCCQSE